MNLVRRSFRTLDPYQQERLVERIREAVRRLREHARGTGREKNRRLHHGDERIAQECEQYRLLAVRLIFHVSVSGFNHAYRFLFRIKENHHTHKWQSGQSPMRMLLKP